MNQRKNPNSLANLLDLLHDDVNLLMMHGCKNEPVNRGDARVIATILRKWLCDQLLLQLERECGVQIELPALVSKELLLYVNSDFGLFFFGPVKFEGRTLPAFYEHLCLSKPTEEMYTNLNTLNWEWFTISKFSKLNRIYFEGQWFKIEELIRFYSNKLGAVHFDTKNNSEKFVRLLDYVSFGPESERKSDNHKIHIITEKSGQILDIFSVCMISIMNSFVQMRVNGEKMYDFGIKKTLKGKILEMFPEKKFKIQYFDE